MPIMTYIQDLKKHEVLLAEADKYKPKLIIEIGTMPWAIGAPLFESYGMSTLKLGEYAQNEGAEFHSCDINPESVENCTNTLKHYNVTGVILHCNDGTKFLEEVATWGKKIDLLYLDNASEPDITLQQFKTAEPLMSDNSVIILDDCHSDEYGEYSKGTTTIPYADKNGYTVIFYEIPTSRTKMAVITKEIR